MLLSKPGDYIVWVPPHGPWDDRLAFVFDGGELGPAVAARLRPTDDELGAVAFRAPAEATGRLHPRMIGRLEAALDSLAVGRPRYLVDGIPSPA